MIALAFMVYGLQGHLETLILDTISDKEIALREGATSVISLSFIEIASIQALICLLHFTGSDVRRVMVVEFIVLHCRSSLNYSFFFQSLLIDFN
jgi:hypothetical protein